MDKNLTDEITKFYNETAAADNYTNYYKTVPFYLKATEFLEQAIKGGLRRFDQVLDVGCGPGHLTADLPGSIGVVGIDISPEMLKKAKVARPTGRYYMHDYHQPLPDDEGTFDIIFASGAFDLCNDICMAMSSLAMSLKDNGLFYFTIPEYRPGTPNNGDRQRNGRPDRQNPIWLNFFSFQEVSLALEKSDLAPISYEYAEGYKSRTLNKSFNYGYWVVEKTQ